MQCSESLAASVQCEVYLSLVWPVCDMNSIGRVVSFIRIQCVLLWSVFRIISSEECLVFVLCLSLYVLCSVHPALRAHAPIPLLQTLNTLRKTYVAMSGVIKFKTVFCLRKIKVFAQLGFLQSNILHIIMLHFHKSNKTWMKNMAVQGTNVRSEVCDAGCFCLESLIIMRHVSCIIHHTSCVMCHVSCVMCHVCNVQFEI